MSCRFTGLQPDQDSLSRLPGRLLNRRRVQRDLAAIALDSFLANLAIGFEVDYGPSPVFFKRKVHESLNQRSIVERANDWRFAPTQTARSGRSCTAENVVGENPFSGVGG